MLVVEAEPDAQADNTHMVVLTTGADLVATGAEGACASSAVVVVDVAATGWGEDPWQALMPNTQAPSTMTKINQFHTHVPNRRIPFLESPSVEGAAGALMSLHFPWLSVCR